MDSRKSEADLYDALQKVIAEKKAHAIDESQPPVAISPAQPDVSLSSFIHDDYKSSEKEMRPGPNNKPFVVTPEMSADALKAAEEVGYRVYEIKGLKDPKNPRVFLVGCHGSGSHNQKAVAKMMEQIANLPSEQQPDIIIFEGDNIYKHGASSPLDPLFWTNFHAMYRDPSLPTISKKPCVLYLGNHDADFWKLAWWSSNPKGRPAELNQVAHFSYLPDGSKYKTVAERKKHNEQEVWELSDVDPENMPAECYSIILGEKQFFFLDSNFIGRDFNDYEKAEAHLIKPVSNKHNQIKWLIENYALAKTAKRDIIIGLHQGSRTCGKRDEEADYDTFCFMNKALLEEIKQRLGTKSDSHNEIIRLILKKCGTQPRIMQCAHDHFFAIDDPIMNAQDEGKNPDDYIIVTNGIGGDSLQDRATYFRHGPVRCHLKNHGFSIFSADGIEVYVLPNERLMGKKKHDLNHLVPHIHLHYDDKNHCFIRNKNPNPQVEKIREAALKACDEYLNILKSNQEATQKQQKLTTLREEATQNKTGGFSQWIHSSVKSSVTLFAKVIKQFYHPGTEEVESLHDVWAYFNQKDLPAINEVTDYLTKITHGLSREENAFVPHLKKALKEAMGEDFAEAFLPDPKAKATRTMGYS